MSDANKPVNRRRIAGERPASAPTPPAKPVVRRTPLKRNAPAATPTPAVPTSERPKVSTAPKAPRSNPKAPRSNRRDLLPLAALALTAVVSLIVGSYFLVTGISGKDSGNLAEAQSQAVSAAGSASETIFSFQYDKLDDHLATSKALMTPAFAEKFESIAPALTELAPQRKIVVQGVAREAAALPCGSDCSPDQVDVLVFLDQARLVGDSTTPTVFANRVKVSMVRNGGDWLVSDIRAL